jgi:hypothetical protein
MAVCIACAQATPFLWLGSAFVTKSPKVALFSTQYLLETNRYRALFISLGGCCVVFGAKGLCMHVC